MGIGYIAHYSDQYSHYLHMVALALNLGYPHDGGP